ncbi:hypothetical protein BDR04DRAFT_1111555, partial [Suillus decipiens]
MSRTQKFVVTLGAVIVISSGDAWETGKVVRTPVCAGRPRIVDSDSLDANVSHHLFS